MPPLDQVTLAFIPPIIPLSPYAFALNSFLIPVTFSLYQLLLLQLQQPGHRHILHPLQVAMVIIITKIAEITATYVTTDIILLLPLNLVDASTTVNVVTNKTSLAAL